MSTKRPTIPTINKPSISKRSKIAKVTKISPSRSLKHINTTVSAKSSVHPQPKKKIIEKLGTCYELIECKGEIIGRRISKNKCKSLKGKSWKPINGKCQGI